MGKNKKKYYDERSRKLGKCKKKKKSRTFPLHASREAYHKIMVPSHTIYAPIVFSFQKNLDETKGFFLNVINHMKESVFDTKYVFDCSEVKEVTADAVMYLLALIRNERTSKKRNYFFSGIYPSDKEARKIFLESGFTKFVRSNSRPIAVNNEKFQIVQGTRNSPSDAGKICKFVNEKFHTSNVYTHDLYSVIIELMSNVYYHAYNNDDVMVQNWYLYAEYQQNEIQIVFLDTGTGIPKTVKKNNFFEKINAKLSKDNGLLKDYKLISSSLNGEFRTQTMKENHGKGLPCVKEFVTSEKCKSFFVFSGKGCCKLNKEKQIKGYDSQNNLFGTIYTLTLKKMEELK